MKQPVTLSMPEGESYFMRHLAAPGSGGNLRKKDRQQPFGKVGKGKKCCKASRAARRDIRGGLCGVKMRSE